MIHEFATTANVRRFMAGLEVLRKPVKGRIGLMVVFGPYGSGKSELVNDLYSKRGIPYVRLGDKHTRRDLLDGLVRSLEVFPKYRSGDIFKQLLNILDENSKPLIIDEADYLIESRTIETVRDISDMTNAPIVLVGMEEFESKLKAYPHLVDRITSTVRFELLDLQGVTEYAEQICEVKLTPSALQYIHAREKGRLRMTTTWLERAERLAAMNDLEVVDAAHLEAYARRESKGKVR